MQTEALKGRELADTLGVSLRAVHDLAARGIIQKVARGAFAPDSVARYCAHLREQAAGRDGGNSAIAAERLREARERADRLALANATSRRELVSAAEVERVWVRVLTDLRAAMLAIPGRIAGRMNLAAVDIAAIDSEIRQALTECGTDCSA
ncbi:hypothetical protein [Bosea sp. 117]|uniref:hypothetical protein n=1 Tax=Bosea sp. 117 TaxID=1125973 RepID=UPI000493F0D5|nr:hypothetical protein [Bosea sp. 117]